MTWFDRKSWLLPLMNLAIRICPTAGLMLDSGIAIYPCRHSAPLVGGHGPGGV